MKMGIPSIAVILLDWSTFEILTLASGNFGVTSQAAQIILNNIFITLAQIPYGIQSTSTALIGA